ncbi:hypothetical protein PDL13_26605 [Bacillus cereus]|nr:hypothetical protein [Bacillus cereus]
MKNKVIISYGEGNIPWEDANVVYKTLKTLGYERNAEKEMCIGELVLEKETDSKVNALQKITKELQEGMDKNELRVRSVDKAQDGNEVKYTISVVELNENIDS